MLNPKIKFPVLDDFCNKNHIKKLSLFGSYSKNTQDTKSDIDLLVEFDTGKTPGYFGLSRLEIELSKMLNGKKVELRTYDELSRYFRDDVRASAIVQYEK